MFEYAITIAELNSDHYKDIVVANVRGVSILPTGINGNYSMLVGKNSNMQKGQQDRGRAKTLAET